MDINFGGCFISCVLLHLPKYVAMETTQFSSVIRGHHIYKEVWEPITARFYSVSNMFDPFTVSIINDGEVVGHVPRRISAECLLSVIFYENL